MNKLLIAFFAGLTLGILFAPDKGSRTRKDLGGALDEVKHTLRTGVDDLYVEGIMEENREV